MASDEELERYLEAAYDETDGNPEATVDPQRIGQKTGFHDDQERETRRALTDKGLLMQEGSGFRLTLPAIHSVEQVRLEKGQDEIVDERREERGTYVRDLYDAADGNPSKEIPLSEIQELLPMDAAAEKRTRAYLDAAGLIAVHGETVSITTDGADWVEGA